MIIYTVIKNAVYDYDTDTLDVKSFRRLDEAKAHLQECVKVYHQDAIRDGWVIEIDSDVTFYAYEDGYECQNHYYFDIIRDTI